MSLASAESFYILQSPNISKAYLPSSTDLIKSWHNPNFFSPNINYWTKKMTSFEGYTRTCCYLEITILDQHWFHWSEGFLQCWFDFVKKWSINWYCNTRNLLIFRKHHARPTTLVAISHPKFQVSIMQFQFQLVCKFQFWLFFFLLMEP
jgi:hypothetical protein